MKRLIALAIAVPALGAAGDVIGWTIDPSHTNATFAVKHMVISTVRGHFGKVTGKMRIDDADIGKSSVEATIDVSTIDTAVPARDADLKSPNFFDVAKYPTMTFRSTRIEKSGDDTLEVTGDLTIKDITRPVTLDVTYTKPINGARGEIRRGFDAKTWINRKEFGLTYSKTVEAGPIVGDRIDIQVEAEAIEDAPRQQAKAAAAGKLAR